MRAIVSWWRGNGTGAVGIAVIAFFVIGMFVAIERDTRPQRENMRMRAELERLQLEVRIAEEQRRLDEAHRR